MTVKAVCSVSFPWEGFSIRRLFFSGGILLDGGR